MHERFFKCPNCKGVTSFDLKDLGNPATNFVACSKCSSEWNGSLLPSCCKTVEVLWVLRSSNSLKLKSNIQSYAK